MSYKDLKFIQEKSTGLFFSRQLIPDSERSRAWLFNEHELLAAVRQRFGGDHGMELVNLLPCDHAEFFRWCGRKGGSVSSPRKTRAVSKNACKNKPKETNVNAAS